MGLRLPAADAAHAGHRRRLRPADPPDLRAVLPHRAPSARRRSIARAALRASRSSDRFWHWLYLPIARGAECLVARRRPAPAGPHLGLPAPTASSRCSRCCSSCDERRDRHRCSQLLQLALALLLAPLLVGWVNQCRAWLQNKSAPPLLLPYRTIRKLFVKDAVVARQRVAALPHHALRRVRLRCAARRRSCRRSRPTCRSRRAADAIALVGLFALARVFIALAAMDIGTAFGTLGARREMLVGFLAEPALLMVLFTASLISGSTSLADHRRDARAPRARDLSRASRSPASRSRWCRSRRTRASRSTTRRRTSSSR